MNKLQLTISDMSELTLTFYGISEGEVNDLIEYCEDLDPDMGVETALDLFRDEEGGL